MKKKIHIAVVIDEKGQWCCSGESGDSDSRSIAIAEDLFECNKLNPGELQLVYIVTADIEAPAPAKLRVVVGKAFKAGSRKGP